MRLATLLMVLATAFFGARPAAAGEAAEGGDEPKAPQLRIGVVDYDKALEGYKRTGIEVQTLQNKYKERGEMLRGTEESLRAEERALASEPRSADSVDMLRRRNNLVEKRAQFDVDLRKYQADMAADNLNLDKSLWDDVRKATAKYAAERGLHLVIKQQNLVDKARSNNGFDVSLAATTLIYYAPMVDCTAEVIKQLNSDYERGRKTVPEKPPVRTPDPPKSGKKS